MQFLQTFEWQVIRDYHEQHRDIFEKWLNERGHENVTEAAICRAVLNNDPENAIRFYIQKRCFELRGKKTKTFEEAVILQKSLRLVKQMMQDALKY